MKKFSFLFKKSFFTSTKRLLRNRNFNFYDVLGLEQDCSNEEIKSAYMKLAKQYHPDINKSEGAEEKFKSITSAYEALNNQRNRDLYDAYMYSDPNSADGDYDFFKRGKDEDAEEYEKARWDKFYDSNKNKKDSEFWGKSRDKEKNKQKFEDEFIKDFESVFNYNFKKSEIKGDDIKLEISISFQDSFSGCVKIIEIDRYEICKSCKGSRTTPGYKISKCLSCSGTGKKHSPLTGIKDCPTCLGKGILVKNPCKTCKGEGLEKIKSMEKIKIDSGILNDTVVKIDDRGHNHSDKKNKNGDLYIKVIVLNEKDTFREDNNLIHVKNISLKEALFGSQYDIKILNINKNIEILPGSSSINNIIYKNEGFEYIEMDVNKNKVVKRGNLVIRLVVNLPDLNKLSNKDKEELIKIFDKI